MIVELFPPSRISKFQREHFIFYELSEKCVVRIEAVVFTLLTKVT